MNKESLLIQLIHILVFGSFLIYVGVAIPRNEVYYYILLSLGILAILYFLGNINKENMFWIIWHIFIIGIILIWVGIQKSKSPTFLFKLLIILGSAAIGYHFIRLVQNIKS